MVSASAVHPGREGHIHPRAAHSQPRWGHSGGAFGPSLFGAAPIGRVPRLEYATGFPTDMVAVRMMKMDQMTAISIAFTRGSMMAAVVRRRGLRRMMMVLAVVRTMTMTQAIATAIATIRESTIAAMASPAVAVGLRPGHLDRGRGRFPIRGAWRFAAVGAGTWPDPLGRS